MILQITNNYIINPSSSSGLLTYIPALTFCFAIFSYFLEKLITNNSKRKQIVRDWYKSSLLDPGLIVLNVFFENIKNLTHKHVKIFDQKKATLDATAFLRYKSSIGIEFQRLKEVFYTETLLPIYNNYPDIEESASSFLLQIQDSFVELFGKDSVQENEFKSFINELYVEKGRLMNALKRPLFFTRYKFFLFRNQSLWYLKPIIYLTRTKF